MCTDGRAKTLLVRVRELQTRRNSQGFVRSARRRRASRRAEVHAQKRGIAELGARACTSSCLDACWAGPVIAVEPDGYFYGRVTQSDLEEIVTGLETGQRVERLVLQPNDYVEPKELKKLES